MRRFIFVFTVVLVIAALAACASSDRGRAPQEPVGNLAIYTSMYENIIMSVNTVLERQFPDYHVQFLYGGTGLIQARIATERAAGKLSADILMVGGASYALEMKEAGLLHNYKSSEASSLAFEYDPDGYWYPVRISNMVLAFNPARTARGSVPASFQAFANDTSLRGAIAMSNPLTSGTTRTAVSTLGLKYGFDFYDALGRQNVAIEAGAVALARLEAGNHRAIMVLEESVLQIKQEEGSRLEFVYPSDGTIMVPSTIMIVAEEWSANKNIPLAEAVTDWFLSPDGQDVIVDGWMHSVRRNFHRYPAGSIPTDQIRANNMPVDWESNFRHKDEILLRFQEAMARR